MPDWILAYWQWRLDNLAMGLLLIGLTLIGIALYRYWERHHRA